MKSLLVRLSLGIVLMVPAASASAADAANNTSYEAKSVHAFLTYCLPALAANDSVSRVAEMMKLPELAKPAEDAFLRGKPGKVFSIPEVGAGIVLSAPDVPMCSVIIQKLDAKEFVVQTDYWFADKAAPFTMTKNDVSPGGEINREYKAKIKDTNILVFMNVRSQPVEGGIQAMITGGRAGE
jgi:hypothetical protein